MSNSSFDIYKVGEKYPIRDTLNLKRGDCKLIKLKVYREHLRIHPVSLIRRGTSWSVTFSILTACDIWQCDPSNGRSSECELNKFSRSPGVFWVVREVRNRIDVSSYIIQERANEVYLCRGTMCRACHIKLDISLEFLLVSMRLVSC